MKKSLPLFLFCIAFNFLNIANAQLARQWRVDYPVMGAAIRTAASDYNGNVYLSATVSVNDQHLLKYDTLGNLVYDLTILPDSTFNDFSYLIYSSKCDSNSIYWLVSCDSTGVVRFDFNGNKIFEKTFENYTPIGILPDNRGHIYCTYFNGEIIIHKMDTLGNTIFIKPFPSDTSAGFIIPGDALSFDRNGNLQAYFENGGKGVVELFDTSGTMTDSIQFGGINPRISGISRDQQNNLVVLYYDHPFGNLIKLDSNLNVVWTSPAFGVGNYFVNDSMDNYYILELQSSTNNYDCIVHKIDASGQLRWSHDFNPDTLLTWWGRSIILDGSGYPIITGVKFDIPTTTINTDNDKYFLEKLTPSGMPDDYYEGYFDQATNPYPLPPVATGSGYNFTVGSVGNGSRVERFCSNCNNNLKGKIIYDANQNCVQDVNESFVSNRIVEVNPGPHYAISDYAGNYRFYLPDSVYTVWCAPPNNWISTCPAAPVIDTISNYIGSLDSIDFGMKQLTGPDLLVNIAHTPVRPVRPILYIINYQNLGDDVATGSVRFGHESYYQLQNSNPVPDLINGDTLIWNFTNLLAGESRNILLSFTIPANTSGTYQNEALIEGMAGDIDLGNNLDVDSGEIVIAHDPNTKQVIPAGIGSEGFITVNDSTLLYKIMFQNTGTDTAFDVLLVDTIDSDLDLTSFRVGACTHPFNLNVSGSGVLKFSFQNIMLPDSVTDELNSYVLLNYYIKQKPNLPAGTEIKNFADVYFDFYPVVRTNSTLNTIADFSTIALPENNSVVISPNPTMGMVRIGFNKVSNHTQVPKYHVQIYDITGKLLINKSEYHSNESIDLTSLQDGVYLVLVSNDKFISRKKIIKTNTE